MDLDEFEKELYYALKYYNMIAEKGLWNGYYPFDSEYRDEVYRRMKEGSVLWIIERTDTSPNNFLMEEYFDRATGSWTSEVDTQDVWVDKVPVAGFMNYSTSRFYLTKERAEEENKYKFNEGGCRSCGNGSKEIPTIITEHEFVPEFDFKLTIKDGNGKI